MLIMFGFYGTGDDTTFIPSNWRIFPCPSVHHVPYVCSSPKICQVPRTRGQGRRRNVCRAWPQDRKAFPYSVLWPAMRMPWARRTSWLRTGPVLTMEWSNGDLTYKEIGMLKFLLSNMGRLIRTNEGFSQQKWWMGHLEWDAIGTIGI